MWPKTKDKDPVHHAIQHSMLPESAERRNQHISSCTSHRSPRNRRSWDCGASSECPPIRREKREYRTQFIPLQYKRQRTEVCRNTSYEQLSPPLCARIIKKRGNNEPNHGSRLQNTASPTSAKRPVSLKAHTSPLPYAEAASLLCAKPKIFCVRCQEFRHSGEIKTFAWIERTAEWVSPCVKMKLSNVLAVAWGENPLI